MTRPDAAPSDRKAGHGSTAGGSKAHKGGHGKGNWGLAGDEEPAPLDPRDPCYPED
jgi:hypothetical protein